MTKNITISLDDTELDTDIAELESIINDDSVLSCMTAEQQDAIQASLALMHYIANY